MLSIIDVLDDPTLQPDPDHPLTGPSWAVWRSVLKAAFALKMSKKEIALFRTVAERDPPKTRIRELWCVIGRRGGKDTIAAAIATYLAGHGDFRGVRRGEQANIMCLATDRDQAGIALGMIRPYFENVPLLASMVTRTTKAGVELRNGARLAVHASNFRGLRGRTVACAIFDECAFWRSDESASPDKEIYTALVPSTLTMPDSMIIGISSPYKRSGLLYEKWKAHFGKPEDDVLVVRGSSRTFNPSLPQAYVDAEIAKDPAAARAEYLAEWRDDIGALLFGRDLRIERRLHLQHAVDQNRLALSMGNRCGEGISATAARVGKSVIDNARPRRPDNDPRIDRSLDKLTRHFPQERDRLPEVLNGEDCALRQCVAFVYERQGQAFGQSDSRDSALQLGTKDFV